MTRVSCLLLVLALSGTGCLSSGSHVEKESRQMPPVRMAEAPPPPVTADQVTETNASDMAQALAREMESDPSSRPAASPLPATMTNTMKP